MFSKFTILYNYLSAKYPKKFNNRRDLESWQDRKVQKFLNEILPESLFYRSYYEGYKLEDWQKFPVINKSIMMTNFDRLNTVGLSKETAFNVAYSAEQSRDFKPTVNNISIGLSSGTSGNRGIFLASETERLKWAGSILGKMLPGSLFSKHRIAFFLRSNSNLYSSVGSSNICFQFYDLLNSIEENVSNLNAFNPSILIAPPSMLRILSNKQKLVQLRINPCKIISVAEVLESIDEKYISNVFQLPVHQVYQCTEGFLGCTCEEGTLHLNEDIVVIQKDYIDKENGRFVPIITDFKRTSQPVIRYRLNDILVEKSSNCKCGSIFTSLERIEGRCDDILYFYPISGDAPVPVFPDFIHRVMLYSSDLIKEYMVTQINIGQINIMMDVPSVNLREISCLIKERLGILSNKMKFLMPKIAFSEYIFDANGIKLRRIKRDFKLEGVDL